MSFPGKVGCMMNLHLMDANLAPHTSPKSDPIVWPYLEAVFGTRHTKGRLEIMMEGEDY